MPYGLRLTLGGAPRTPHNVIDPKPGSRAKLIVNIIPGDIVPLEERGIPLEDARTWHEDPGCPLELVQLDADGGEVTAFSRLKKGELVAHAAALNPPLVLDEGSTKEELIDAIEAHVPAEVSSDEGQLPADDSTEGKD